MKCFPLRNIERLTFSSLLHVETEAMLNRTFASSGKWPVGKAVSLFLPAYNYIESNVVVDAILIRS